MIGACSTLWKKTGYVGCLPFSCPLMKSSAPCGCPVPSSKNSCHWVCLSRVVASSMNCCMEPITCTWLLVNAAPVPTTLSRLSPSTLGSPCPAACWASSPRGLQPLCPVLRLRRCGSTLGPMALSSSSARAPSAWETCAVKRFAPFQRGFPLYVIGRSIDFPST